MTRTFAAVILVGWLCGVPNATAQEKRPYVAGGFMVVPWGGAHSLPGGPSTSFTNTGPEAVNTGLVAEAGWFLTENVTAGVEVAVPFQRNPVTQSHGYFDGSYRLVGRLGQFLLDSLREGGRVAQNEEPLIQPRRIAIHNRPVASRGRGAAGLCPLCALGEITREA
jgi:hypothetical protein